LRFSIIATSRVGTARYPYFTEFFSSKHAANAENWNRSVIGDFAQ